MSRKLTGIILAAGFGSRMKSDTPKVLFPLLGRPLLDYPRRVLREIGCRRVVAVIGAGADQVRAVFDDGSLEWALQDPPRGTGDAARVGLDALGSDPGPVVILNGDLPLLTAATVGEVVDAHRDGGAALTLLTLHREDPQGYGRIVRESGDIVGVVEQADATPDQREIQEVNAGVYVADGKMLREGLAKLEAAGVDNAQGELYLPPVIGPIREVGGVVGASPLAAGREWELQQVNDRVDLGKATEIRRDQILAEWQRNGVTVVDPRSTYIEEDVEIGRDTVIQPFSVIRSGVAIGARCEVGPFAHLRVGTEMADEAEVGNFTEVKKTRMGRGSKAKHLSYLGDGEVGEGVNIGAGTIFANYDGVKKHLTRIGDGAFVGSGTIFVAPVDMGERSRTGAGAVVPRGCEIAAGQTVVGVPARVHRPREE